MLTNQIYMQWAQIVDDLRGTAGFPIPDEWQDDPEFLSYLDQEIFICDTCGWWCERSEESYHPKACGTCITCAEEAGFEEH